MRYSLLTLVLVAACGSSDVLVAPPAGPAPVVTTSVTMQSRLFAPASIQVSPGATVTFTNADNFNHNVTFSGGAVATIPNFATGAKTAVMPMTAGLYNYTCTLHSGMNGSVTVK